MKKERILIESYSKVMKEAMDPELDKILNMHEDPKYSNKYQEEFRKMYDIISDYFGEEGAEMDIDDSLSNLPPQEQAKVKALFGDEGPSSILDADKVIEIITEALYNNDLRVYTYEEVAMLTNNKGLIVSNGYERVEITFPGTYR